MSIVAKSVCENQTICKLLTDTNFNSFLKDSKISLHILIHVG